MKKFLITTMLAIGLNAVGTASAAEGSSCHFHGNTPAAPETVSNCAAQQKDSLVKKGKLDQSWQAVKQVKLDQVDGKKGKEWLVTFKNPAVQDKSKETLYMFFTTAGNFIAANFSGK
jgi:hypothetical protein